MPVRGRSHSEPVIPSMKISCPSCQSKYTIADDKVQGRSVKVRCRKCGETIHVTSSGVGDPATAPPGAAEDSGAAAFSVLIAEGDQRDMSLQELVSAYNSGHVTADTFVWGEGQADWMPLGQVSAIVEAINAASAAVDAAREAAPAPEPAPAPMAAAPAAAPMFGGDAGGFPAAAHEPAAVKARRDVDLFGASPQQEEVATSAPALGSVVAPQKAAGTRDESSVLFSLSALTSSTATAPSSPTNGGSPGGAPKDDSGLIDLKALAAKADQPKAQASPMMGGILDAAPLLGTPLLDTPGAAAAAEPVETKKSKAPMFIGIGIGIAGLAIAGALFVALKKPPPTPAPVASAPSATASEVAAAPSTTDSSGAAPPSTGAPSASAAAPTKGGKYTGGKTTKKGDDTKGGTAPAPTPTTTAAKKPPVSPCGCAPTDLMCNMNCQVKKK